MNPSSLTLTIRRLLAPPAAAVSSSSSSSSLRRGVAAGRRWLSGNGSSSNASAKKSSSSSASNESKSTFGPLQYGMLGLLAAGMVGATFYETKTAKELGLKRSMTQTYDMTRRKTGEFASGGGKK
eukprot:scaffold3846_cov108-Amphora_coffeaeformis.AAC.2